MSKKLVQYSAFLGSPSDLNEERKEVKKRIEEINRLFGSQQNYMIELLTSDDSPPGITNDHIQDLIDKDIGEYDIFIGILWKKFGTETKRYNSGTEQEFMNAVNRFKNGENIQILFYFKNHIDSKVSDINPDELNKVFNFKKGLIDQNVKYSEFDNIEELGHLLISHIPTRIKSLNKSVEKRKNNSPNREKEAKELMDEINNEVDEIINQQPELGIIDYLNLFSDHYNSTSTWISKINESHDDFLGEFVELESFQDTSEIGIGYDLNSNNVIVATKLMKEFHMNLNHFTPKFYENLEKITSYGSNIVNLSGDLSSKKTIADLKGLLSDLNLIFKYLIKAIKKLTTVDKYINELPRIEKDFISAKNELSVELKVSLEKLHSAKKLMQIFSNQAESKIKNMQKKSNIIE